MVKSKLRQHAIETYKHAPLSSWILGITTGILIAAVFALDLLVPALALVTFPLIVLPIMFSASLQHVVLKTNGQITFSSSIRAFGLYFRRDFIGCFSFWISLVKSIILFFIFELLISSIVSFVFTAFNPDFLTVVDQLYALVESAEMDIEAFNNLFVAYDEVLLKYMLIVMVPSIALAYAFLVYNVSRSSITIYYRLHTKNSNNRFIRFVHSEALRGQRLKMMGNYLMLNWPLYVLILLGFGGGAVLGYFWQHNVFAPLSCGLVMSALLAMFFLPFYFSNQQALYDYYANDFNNAAGRITKMMIDDIQSNIELSQEERERLEQSISDLNGPLEDEDNDNKKDPDGPQ